MTRSPTLVVLAAGLGSRFGGPKQLEPLGPDGATLMDYSVFDARRAGFGRAVLVVRPDLADAFREQVVRRIGSLLPVELVPQRADRLPAGFTAGPRLRPWGTAHAVLAAREVVGEPFAVLNADDLYGRDALQRVGGFLRVADPAAPRWAVIGYRLAQTVSPAGGVNRARLELDERECLRRVEEVIGLVPDGDEFVGRTPEGSCRLRADTLISMNLWGFTPALFPLLEDAFTAFLESDPGERDEFPLPTAIQSLLGVDGCTVQVIPTTSRWCGVTYPADRDRVRAELERLTAAGEYPRPLWDHP